jgi:hypothetical protein
MPSSHPLSAVALEISSPRKPYGGVKSGGGGDYALHGAKVLIFLPQLKYIQEYPCKVYIRNRNVCICIESKKVK